MKKISYTIFCLLFLNGCANTYQHIYGTEKIPKNKLSSFSYYDDEVKLLSVDNKPFKGNSFKRYYIKPGNHKFKFALNWTNWIAPGVVVGVGTSPYKKRVNINMKAGKNYYFHAKLDKSVEGGWKVVKIIDDNN